LRTVSATEPATAEFHVLSEGYLSNDDDRVGSSVSFARDGDVLVVIDPGLVPSRAAILDPLAALGVGPEQVTDVVISHHHPDHTLNVALFPNARLHDHWAWYRDDLWVSRPAEGFELSPAIRLIETPGHSPQDISTLADTAEGLVVATHLWWTATAPVEDPYAPDPDLLRANRARVLALPGLVRVVPGHGAPFVPGDDTPA
jgi:glyoxylase-like metal-dependent hydrolase (beta-lactamase superfamily II)